MASPSASVIHSEKKYDVFLNFRGPDTRLTFTSHLYKALNDMKINTYIDNKLDKGGDIAPALLKAIEESKISVIIFSEQYATSAWCLDELVHILKCQETNDAAYVIPVFYKIKPTDVRFQKGCYELEEFFKDRAKKERRLKWKDALTKASNLFGFDSSSNTVRDDSDLIEQVVKDVLKKLGRCDTCAMPKSSSDLNGLLGGESVITRMDSFSSSLQFLPQDNIVRSAFIPISVKLTPPFDAVFLSFMVTLHNLPRMLVHLNQTDQGRISLFVLLAAIPFTLDFIGPLAFLILTTYVFKNEYLYRHRHCRGPRSLQGESISRFTPGQQFLLASDLCICLLCIVFFGIWVDTFILKASTTYTYL